MSRSDGGEVQRINTSLAQRVVDVRRYLHRNPELSNEERGTQRYLKSLLLENGIEDVREVAGFGLAVDIVGAAANSNRKVAIRADIDALPIVETSGVEFSSQNDGVMHACGHDAHAAMVFGAAMHLHSIRDSFAGVVRLIFQPAEEAEPLGGRRVIEEGLLDDIDNAIGIHVDPYTPTGKMGVAAGPYSLASDIFDVTVSGSPAHAAKPSEGVDAIAVACTMVSELQKIVSREIDPYDPLVVSITGIQGGGAYNVLADTVHIKGTVRSGHNSTRKMATERILQILEGIAAAHRAIVRFELTPGEPAVINDPAMTRILADAAGSIIGSENVLPLPGWTAADDFAFYSAKRPSVYFRLGIRNEAVGSVFPLHHPKFRVDEAALPIGIDILCRAAISSLQATGE
ncbi:M20 metallopeptidase family protein [Rhizobium mesosinicum]|uniref:Amidohydrolase n=1 Tax=Rhizobium mesosinicum TaxID=335017 RepID=A0ABS7GM91_9HYPH|nr:amidohydrolase [Rhizobium mesosinicum]MBW9051112.1 amidohydrolase [Rhizobium mesosinicum]